LSATQHLTKKPGSTAQAALPGYMYSRQGRGLFRVSEEIFHFVFVNDHLLVGVSARCRVFYGFYHFHMVFTGARIAARCATRAFLETFFAMVPQY
jgi:phage major head subunit gpT-like protein